jgi:hypothetical protein
MPAVEPVSPPDASKFIPPPRYFAQRDGNLPRTGGDLGT